MYTWSAACSFVEPACHGYKTEYFKSAHFSSCVQWASPEQLGLSLSARPSTTRSRRRWALNRHKFSGYVIFNAWRCTQRPTEVLSSSFERKTNFIVVTKNKHAHQTLGVKMHHNVAGMWCSLRCILLHPPSPTPPPTDGVQLARK